jgi:hypothetical protein
MFLTLYCFTQAAPPLQHSTPSHGAAQPLHFSATPRTTPFSAPALHRLGTFNTAHQARRRSSPPPSAPMRGSPPERRRVRSASPPPATPIAAASQLPLRPTTGTLPPLTVTSLHNFTNATFRSSPYKTPHRNLHIQLRYTPKSHNNGATSLPSTFAYKPYSAAAQPPTTGRPFRLLNLGPSTTLHTLPHTSPQQTTSPYSPYRVLRRYFHTQPRCPQNPHLYGENAVTHNATLQPSHPHSARPLLRPTLGSSRFHHTIAHHSTTTTTYITQPFKAAHSYSHIQPRSTSNPHTQREHHLPNTTTSQP